jgi:hypothetical protein
MLLGSLGLYGVHSSGYEFALFSVLRLSQTSFHELLVNFARKTMSSQA